MANAELKPLGSLEYLDPTSNRRTNREYYCDPAGGNIFWRVPAIREAIRAAEGWKIISADYSQIEVKIMAFLSQDPWLISAINSKKDIHSYMCCEIKGYDYDFFYAVLKEKYLKPDAWRYGTDPAYGCFSRDQLINLHNQYNTERGETKCVTSTSRRLYAAMHIN